VTKAGIDTRRGNLYKAAAAEKKGEEHITKEVKRNRFEGALASVVRSSARRVGQRAVCLCSETSPLPWDHVDSCRDDKPLQACGMIF
jgi:hypothetical protein